VTTSNERFTVCHVPIRNSVNVKRSMNSAVEGGGNGETGAIPAQRWFRWYYCNLKTSDKEGCRGRVCGSILQDPAGGWGEKSGVEPSKLSDANSGVKLAGKTTRCSDVEPSKPLDVSSGVKRAGNTTRCCGVEMDDGGGRQAGRGSRPRSSAFVPATQHLLGPSRPFRVSRLVWGVICKQYLDHVRARKLYAGCGPVLLALFCRLRRVPRRNDSHIIHKVAAQVYDAEL